ncbi:uncharacterized protein [Engystomops pustulosus]|uniref:uncharacterized protein isoform X3 n=1 Tax=Engystomops pustulosus TaxID=76066 RepID=UPI003AFAA3F3
MKIPSSVSSSRTASNMGTNRGLFISIGALLIFLTCIYADGQNKLSEEDWDSFDQDYGQMNVEDYESAEEQQNFVEDDEDVQQQSDGGPSQTNIITSPAPVYRSINPSHNQKICSTFGNFHFKTFDGDIYHFPGRCSYHFVRHCKTNYEEFFVGITREIRKSVPVISGIHMKIEGVEIVLAEKSVTVNSESVEELPFSIGTTQISKSGTYIRISSKIGFELFWNEEDSITLELSQKYVNQTCGLCGDYNGIPIYNEFVMNNVQLSNLQYGSLQKYHNPEEEMCQDTKEEEEKTCPMNKHLCESVLTGAAFQECNKIVDVQKYVEICEHDICRCKGNTTGFCLCNIFTEYSRQCTHAGGKPKNWRTSKICPLRCAFNLQFKECGTACPDTCTNPERSLVCDDHCKDGCFCPTGLVFDDIRKTGCIPKEECPCTYNGEVYATGKGYGDKCQDCTCKGGKWSCVKKPCFAVCALEGGSHITTFDFTRYNFHGDCTYTLAKHHDSNLFSILAEINKCGQKDTETCLRSITINFNGGKEFIYVKKCGSVYVNSVYTQLPISTAAATIFRPTSFYTIVATNMGVQIKIQTVPTMQVYIEADPKHMDKILGLCGNYNEIQIDDFKSPAGVVEGTGSSFGNLWKSQLDCPNVKNSFEDPCALLGQNEQYASHHCDLLLASDGPFADCHKTVDPEPYHKNCMFDSCNCEKKEDCMCSALSSYVTACSRQEVDLRGWRKNVCHSYTATCQAAHTYSYTVSTCTPSCRGLSEPDVTCKHDIGFVDGCICEDGTYRDDNGNCVLPSLCSCYYKGTAIAPREVIHDNGAMCTCVDGKMECIGVNPVIEKECEAPMIYFDCKNATAEAKGSECQKRCSTFDTDCYSTGCVSGCVCPEGLVLDDERNICIPEEHCPCKLNDDYYASGETVQVKCNTCTCKHRKWDCTTNTCMGTCAVYGDGHYHSFDQKIYRFNGNCMYTLAQDYCSNDATAGTFRILTENVPCGSQGTTCSKSIRLFLGNYELRLGDQKFDVVKRNSGKYVPFKVRQMGIYLTIEAANGLALVWDKKTSIMIKLDSSFEGKTCGLCGNYDGNAANDYITRSQSVVGDMVEFGNSWKVLERCPNAVEVKDTCASNPYRKAWSQKQCSIITSSVFASCHSVVDPVKYYEACVNDACACDAGGDCDCFCTAVAAYAQACSEAGQCIKWRTPNICPIFCDYYNQQGHCEWHYKACGAPCLKTCMNPTGVCYNKLTGLEGCYPTCPEDRPFFDEESMRCVATCNCYDEYGEEYKPGEKMPGATRCSECTCTKNGKECTPAKECCHYEDKEFLPGDIVYSTADEIGGCINAICSDNSTIERSIGVCPTKAPTTTFDFTSHPSTSSEETGTSAPSTAQEGSSTPSESSPGTSTTEKSTEKPTSKAEMPTSSTGASYTSREVPTASPTTCVEAYDCTWSKWYDNSKPEDSEGDFELIEDIQSQDPGMCKNPRNVQCRAKELPDQSLNELGQDVTCNRKSGLICLNSKNPPLCHNFEMRVECCKLRDCTTTPSSTSHEDNSTPSLQTPAPTTKEQPSTLAQETSQPSSSTNKDTSTPGEVPTTQSTVKSGEPTPQKPETSSTRPETEKTTSPEETPKATTPSPTTTCVYKMECRWTKWYDSNKPNNRSDGGDTEKVQDVVSKGQTVCTDKEVENKMECQAVDDNGFAIADNRQKYSCDLKDGLVCKHRDQQNKEKCSNYEMRIECCQKVCEEAQTPGVTTAETTEQKSTNGETTTQGTTGPESQPTQHVSTQHPSPTEKPSTPEVTPSQTTLCVYKMECRWTEWFDNNKPSPKSDQGDFESITNITSSGTEVCKSGEVADKMQCEAVDSKGEPITDNNQKFTCNLTEGLICRNRDQKNKEKCSNYRMRVLCCAEVCEPVPTPAIRTTETSEPTTHGISTTTLHGSSSIPSTKTSGTETSPSEGTSSSSTPSELTTSASSTKAACEEKMECRWTQWYDINTPSKQSNGGDSESPSEIKSKGLEICKKHEVEKKIECEAIDHDGAKIADNQQIVTCALGSGLTCLNADQNDTTCHNYRMRELCCSTVCEPVVTTTKSSPAATQSSRPTTSSVTEPNLSSSKDCEDDRASECRWTEWFNEDTPSTDINGGEIESPEKLRAAGIKVCKQGEVENQIECKSEQDSESEANLAQNTTCNLKDGLICMNSDQYGKNCKDHSIRIECCSEKFVNSCGESTTPSYTKVTGVPTTISATQPSTSESRTKHPDTSYQTSPGRVTEEPTSPTSCIKKMECYWTPWYDNNPPNPKGDGGDTESAQEITAKGQTICNKNETQNKIECEALDKAGVRIMDNQQKFTCDLKNGLSCLNKNQTKKEKCYNYRIRFECCSEYCEKVATPTTVLYTTPGITVSESMSVESTPPDSFESTPPSKTKSPTSSTGVSSAPTTSYITTTEGASEPPATTTSCEKLRQNECRWTEWHNTDKPSSDPSGKDIENSEKLKSKNISVCTDEEVENKIECGSVQYPHLKFEEIGQKASCDLTFGLVCENIKQVGDSKQCLDYGIRYECCSKKFIKDCGNTTPTPTSPSTAEVSRGPLTTSTTVPEGTTPSKTGPEETTPGKTGPAGTTPSETGPEGTTPGQTGPEGTTPGKTSPEGTTPAKTGPEATTPGQTGPEGTTPSQTGPEGTTPGQTGPEGTTPGQTGPEGTTPGKTVPEGTTPGKTGPEGTTPGQTGPEGTTPGKTVPEGTTPGQTGPEGTTPGKTGPEGTTPGKTGPEGTTPGQTGPEGTTPGQTGPEGTTPGKTVPEATTPGQTRPEGTTPGKTGPEGTTPGKTVPEGTTPGQTGPEGTTPGKTGPEGTTPGKTGPEGTTPSQTGPEGTTPGQTGPEGTTPGQTGPEGTTPGKTVPEGTTPGQTGPEGTTPGKTGPEGTTPGKTGPEGTTPGKTAPEGTTPGQTGPEGTTPGKTGPEGTTPGKTGPEGTTPGKTGPEGTTPGKTGPEGTTPGKTGPEGTTPGKTGPEGTTPGKTGPEGTTPGKTGPEGTTPGKTAPEGTTPSETGPEGTTPGKTGPEGTTPGKTGPEGTTPGQTGPEGTTHGKTGPEGTTPSETGPEGTTPGKTGPEGTTPGKTGPEGTTPSQTGPEGTTPGKTGPEETTPGKTGPEGTTPGKTGPEGTTPGKTAPEGTTPSETGPEGTTPGKTGPEGTTPGKTGPEGTTPGQTGPEGTTHGKTGPEGTTPSETGPEGTTPGKTGPEGTTPGKTGPEGTTPSQTGPEGTTPGKTGPEETTPGKTGPEGTTPGKTGPEGTTPGKTAPEGTTPSETGPEGTTPGKTGPEGTTPGKTGPEGTTPGQTGPEGTTPGKTGPEGTTPSETGPEGTTPGKTGPERTTPGQTGPEGTSPGQTGPEGTTPGQTGPEGTTPSQTGPEGTTPGKTGPEGTTPGKTGPEGTTPVKTGPEGTTPSETGPEGTTPGQTGPEGTTSGQTGPEGTTPGKTGPEGTTPGQTGPEGTTPGKTGPEGTTPGKTGPEGTTPGQTGPEGTTPGKTGPEGTTLGKTGPEGTTPGQTGPEGTTPGKTGPEGSTPGQTRPEGPTSGEPTSPTLPSNCNSLRDKDCHWTEWFNEQKPSSGINGGDKETSQYLTSLGKEVCGKEEIVNAIECKAENNSQNVKQVVMCNVNDGLICENSDQLDEEKQCLDHAMRIECCSKKFVEKCRKPSTSTTAPETSSKETTGPEGTTPSETGPEGTTPGKTGPEGTTPSETGPEETTPGQTGHEGTTPGKTGPEGTTSGQTGPEGTTPGKTGPEGTTPGKTGPEGTTPEGTTPSETGPEGTTPGKTGPEGTTPSQTGPEGTTPGQTGPEGTTPGQTGPEGTTPGTSTSISSTASPVTVTSTSGTTAHPTGHSPVTTSSATPSGSPEIFTTAVTPEKTTPPTSESSYTHPGTPTSCFCKVNEELFSPGETIYNKKDKQGCSFHAVCGATCQIDYSVGECSSTVQPTTSKELTSIKDVSSKKPSMTRPSRKPGTRPSPSEEVSASTEHECGPCECLMPNCSTGYRVVSKMAPGACCATITCEPDAVCVEENTIYMSGSSIPQAKNSCQKCECSKDEKDEYGFYAVKCQELTCDKTCETGFAYEKKEGECCGECVPKQCTMKKVKVESGENAESGQMEESGQKQEQGEQGENGEKEEGVEEILIQIGDTYQPEGSTCSYYECDEEDGKPVLTKVKIVCQELDITKCEEGTVKYDENGCCKTCTPKTEVELVEKPVLENCSTRKNVTVLKEDDCEEEVTLTYCGGPCMGTSIYSAESQGMDHTCSCCTELEVVEREVELLCANGQRKKHHYKDVVRCGCSVATCEPLKSAEIQEPQQEPQQYQSRR